jgi:hypothetical protein
VTDQNAAQEPQHDATAPPPTEELRPLPVPMRRIVEIGILAWVVALVVVLVVPALHTGDRDWWPWTCVAGIVLGGIGWSYLRRGRGNARDAG